MLRTTLLTIPLVAFATVSFAGGCSDGHYNATAPAMTEAPEVAMSAPVVEPDLEAITVASAQPCMGLVGDALATCTALHASE